METHSVNSEKAYVLDNPFEDLGGEFSNNQEIQITYYNKIYKLPLGAVRYSTVWRNLIKDTGICNFIPNNNEIVNQIPVHNPIVELTPEQVRPYFENLLDILKLYYLNPFEPDRHTFGGEDHEIINTKLSAIDKKWSEYDKEYNQNDYDRIACILLICDYLGITELLHTCCQILADKLQNLSEEEIIKVFKLKEDQLPTDAQRKEIEEKYAFLKGD